MNNASNINSEIPSLSVRYNRYNIGEYMIKLILTCLAIPLLVYFSISMVVLVSPLIIGGLIYITLKYRREMV